MTQTKADGRESHHQSNKQADRHPSLTMAAQSRRRGALHLADTAGDVDVAAHQRAIRTAASQRSNDGTGGRREGAQELIYDRPVTHEGLCHELRALIVGDIMVSRIQNTSQNSACPMRDTHGPCVFVAPRYDSRTRSMGVCPRTAL